MYSPSSPRDDASGSRDPSIPLTPSLPISISEPYTPYDQQLAPKYSTSPMHVPYYHEDSYYSSKASNLDEEYNPHEQQSLKPNPPPQPQDQEYSPSFSVPFRRYSEQSPASYFPSYQYVLSPVLPTARSGSGTRISPPLPPMALPAPRRTSGSLPLATQDNFARQSSDGRSRSPSSGAYGNWEASQSGKRNREEEDEVESTRAPDRRILEALCKRPRRKVEDSMSSRYSPESESYFDADCEPILGRQEEGGKWKIFGESLGEITPQMQILMARALRDSVVRPELRLYQSDDTIRALQNCVPWFAALILSNEARLDERLKNT